MTYPSAQLAWHGSSATPEWYTESHVIERVVRVLGTIDLDPCSNPPPYNVPATLHMSRTDGGLNQRWHGRVYMKPYYDRAHKGGRAMNPEDDDTTMSEDEVMDEEYIGALENLGEAVEHWMDVQVREIEMEPVEAAEMAMRAALDRWVAIRDRNREVRERRAALTERAERGGAR